MAMVEINKNPSRGDLRGFGIGLPIFFGLLGALKGWHGHSLHTAEVIWAVGAGLSLVYLAIPPLRRRIYLGWMYLTYPIAWTVSHLVLGVLYFLVATPAGLLMRLFGRDPMNRKFDKAAKTYWVLREPTRDKRRYFQQF